MTRGRQMRRIVIGLLFSVPVCTRRAEPCQERDSVPGRRGRNPDDPRREPARLRRRAQAVRAADAAHRPVGHVERVRVRDRLGGGNDRDRDRAQDQQRRDRAIGIGSARYARRRAAEDHSGARGGTRTLDRDYHERCGDRRNTGVALCKGERSRLNGRDLPAGVHAAHGRRRRCADRRGAPGHRQVARRDWCRPRRAGARERTSAAALARRRRTQRNAGDCAARFGGVRSGGGRAARACGCCPATRRAIS